MNELINYTKDLFQDKIRFFYNINKYLRNKVMLRAFSIKRLFSQFYHPHKFNIDASVLQPQVCRLHSYVSTYREHGHHYARLDPLQLYNKEYEQFVRPTDFGIRFQDSIENFTSRKSLLISKSQTIEQLENNLRRVYTSGTGVEFSHITQLQQKQWLYESYETAMLAEIPMEKRIQIAKVLVEAESLDLFLHKKFVTFKRYSGEGAESTIVALNQLFEKSAEQGYQHIVFGMPHRGRMNLLTNILEYPPRYLFRKISGKTDTPKQLFTVVDDVTSHVSQSIVKTYSNNKEVKITMVHNPSHLEAQNPVSMGKTKSKQHYHGMDKVVNVQVHGDSAICGQGIVYESFVLGRVPKYNIDGTIHIITNNQLGYTTRPIDSRGSKYCSDIAKAFDTPVIHVNSQNIEDVYKVMNFCVEYKKKWKKDILVDLICYRKYGHNEVDEPEFTQPKMYNKIRKNHESNAKKYPKLLHKQGVVGEKFYSETKENIEKFLEQEFEAAKSINEITLKGYMNSKSKGPRAFTEYWSKFKPSLYGREFQTGFDTKMLREFAQTSVSIPLHFTVHPRIKKYHIDQRLKSIQSNSLNWATCQALALFSLNFQGYNIRLTGQDVQRGTFSQRHINLTDQKTQHTFNSLQQFSKLQPGRGQVQIYNSPLSENAAMSYQYGYAIDHPHNMTVWEAQFGDFFNTAQVVIDTFLTNSENKWLRQNALTLVLPHGYDGAGPQHSSCRIERFLQLANSDGNLTYKKLSTDKSQQLSMDSQFFWQDIQSANFSFIFPTKPSNIFHALRRQMKRDFRKPLIIAGPKGLLRHNKCVSKLEDMGPGTKFQRIWKHRNVQKIDECESILLCSGKFVYDIDEILQKEKKDRTALLTIEELFPFPEAELKGILSKCSSNAKVFWVQEENLNSGAFEFVQPRITRVLNDLSLGQLTYIGRRALATTAVGSSELHKKESVQLAEWIKKVAQ